ncbi:GNAT family N-acetyltransferase [Citrobacter sp. JGM124]|uniref:GNAT family N-acetyltransferase n=1 Tax=Citrobacter sp. JGM124 TaxID=2799789 RepID=UPI001BAE0D98|nr:GNAT family N-acetyltransferase [Citrobacter sp. JGM124]MBS0847073.1 GNAT family N-acetyltransferase [Citrobacter sp. JGM124]
MVTFRPMTEDEYLGYQEYFIPDYAQEISSSYALSWDDSLARAKQEITEYLPAGVKTPGHILLSIVVGAGEAIQQVGYLWYKPDTIMRTVFIYDFHIFTACQGQGLGKKALHALEQDLREQHFSQIRLRVAGDNARAQHVYKTRGFGVTGINMSKNIIPSDEQA